MTETVDELIEALRIELQHFGELLALLDTDSPTGERGLPAIVGVLDSIRAQGEALGNARAQRLRIQARLAWAAQHPGRESLRDLLSDVPPDYQPLLRALADELEDLAVQVRQRAQFNHQQLNDAARQLARFIDSITVLSVPDNQPTPQSAQA